MKIETVEYLLPAHWASALINNDYSGIDDKEERELSDWIELQKLGNCISCSDEQEFTKHNDANALAGDCLTFTFQANKQLG
jgi:hypothetical protein